jgi:tRNA-modifying protein YgfZ
MTSSGPDVPTTTPAGVHPSAFWCDVARDVVEVVGADAATYLHSQVSNDLRPLQVGQSCWAFLLQPTGKVDVLLRVWRTADDRFVLDTDAGFGEVMVARVNRFKIRVKADVSPLSWRCIAVRTTDGSPVVGVDGVTAWGGGVDLLGADVEPPAGIPEGSAAQLLAARIDAGWPAMGTEIEPGETIPAETGVTSSAVSFTKGCYPGQELVERMDSRGSIAPRLLQVVDVAAGTCAGDPLLRDGEQIGTVTSVAGARALAYVKRSALQA